MSELARDEPASEKQEMPPVRFLRRGHACYVELTTPDQSAARTFYGSLFGLFQLMQSPSA